MLEKIQRNKLSLGTKLSLATLGAVVCIMAILVLAIGQGATRTLTQRAHTEMQQSVDMVYSFLSSSDEDLRQRTKRATEVFRSENVLSARLLEAGGRKLLMLNGSVANGDQSTLERFEKLASATSALFLFNDGQFQSVASTFKKEDGEPAIGLQMAANTPAHQALLKGDEYLGIASFFGKTYMAHYTPLRDAEQKVVGALLIGMDFGAFLENLKKSLRSLKVGESGYYFVMRNDGDNRGVVAVHPRVEGDQLWEREDDKGGKYIQHMINTQRGVHTYNVVNAKDGSVRTMITSYATFAPWNWVIAASINESEVQEANHSLQLLVAALGAVGAVLMTVVIYLVIRRTVVQPLAQGLVVSQAIAAGDLSQRAQVRSDDEIGQLLGAINHTTESLEGLIRTVQHKAQGVMLASNEIARGNADLASRTESSASALEQTAAAMEELGSTVRHNADSATTADMLAREAQNVVTGSGATVSALVQTMAGIDQSSQRIAHIIGVIDGIAFQTNILALNAAVEAARAGEHGRGFAVVASEVRSLAGRSAEAAKEIKTLIQSSVDEVRTGNDRAVEAGDAMQKAIAEIERVGRVISEISHASIEQSNGVGQVAEAITSMDQATQKNAALVEEMAAAAEGLSSQANELLQAVAVFKLRHGSQATPTDLPRLGH